jgi:hypothetical protein
MEARDETAGRLIAQRLGRAWAASAFCHIKSTDLALQDGLRLSKAILTTKSIFSRSRALDTTTPLFRD